MTGLKRNTNNRYLSSIRERIAGYCEHQSSFSGEIEVDESCFGARRIKGKQGRDAFGKTACFGVIKRVPYVYTEIVPDCRKSTLQVVVRGRVALDSDIYSDRWCSYNGLLEFGCGRHLRVNYGRDKFVRSRSHINGIEGFCGFARSLTDLVSKY